MALGLNDLLNRRLDIIGKVSQASMVTVATTTLFTSPSGTYGAPGGMKQTVIAFVVLSNPNSAIGASITANIGSPAANTDFAGSGSITLPTSAVDTIVRPPAAWIAYSTGIAFNFQITVGSTGLCDIYALGWTE